MDLRRIEAILRLLREQPYVGEIVADGEGWSLRARRSHFAPSLAGEAPVSETGAEPERRVIRAGVVGVYRAPVRPVQPGDLIQAGRNLGSIDSMRILNPVAAEIAGVVTEVLVDDGDPVEYGQPLFELAEPSEVEA